MISHISRLSTSYRDLIDSNKALFKVYYWKLIKGTDSKMERIEHWHF